jgi:hypothetical protein
MCVKRDIGALSRNYFNRGKVINIKHSERVSVRSHFSAPYFIVICGVAYLVVPYFSTFSRK